MNRQEEMMGNRIASHARTAQPLHIGRTGVAERYEYGSLIFDLNSIVRFCSSALARRLGRSPEALRGVQVRELFPDLPFRSNTPGYNVAVSRVMFAAPRHPLQVLTSGGMAVPVQVSVQQFMAGSAPLFNLEAIWRR
jgi:hypothetical protein